MLSLVKSAGVIVALMALLVMPSEGIAQSRVHDLCEMSWASEPEQRRKCVEAQIAGAQIVARYLDWAKQTAGADSRHVIEVYERCQRYWLPDYAMMSTCLRNRSAISPP